MHQKHVPIPEIGTPEFPGDLVKKREFSLSEGRKGCSSSETRRLTAVQQFVGTFMSPLTPYRSILLKHGTGMGKTCAAVQAAELHGGGRKTVVIVPSSIQGGFESNIYSSERAAEGATVFDSSRFQCTGSSYYSKDYEGMSKTAIRKAVRSRIRKRYEFYGHDMFGNFIDQIYNRIERDYVGDAVEVEKRTVLRTLFDNRDFVVDEVHSLRSAEGSEKKRAYTALLEVLEACDGIRLILLTATPMFNRAPEIVDIVNLLLVNEKRGKLKESEVFDKGDKMTPGGAKRLQEALQGRVSDMSFEDDTFPVQITPSQAGVKGVPGKQPTKQKNGKLILPSDRLPSTPALFYSRLGKEQMKASRRLIGMGGLTEGQQIENVCYDGSWTETSETAFKRAFKSRSRRLRFSYADPQKRYLSPALIDDHAPKIGAAVRLIKEARGACFLYSHYKWSGVYPAAVALEEAGFIPYKGDTLLEDAPAAGSATAPRYVVITKEDESEDGMTVTDKVAALNDISSRIKVVLGTDTASQGLDFKRIREVHVLEPWWNMSKIRQVTGRGIRKCSHASLDDKYRNTTVYLHCTITGTERETQDQHGYRTAIKKNVEVERVEALLSEAAVDCGLYEMREPAPIEMESSQGKALVARRGNSSSPKCSIKWPKKREDRSTVHPYVYKNMVDLMAWDVKDALTWLRAGTFSQIRKAVGATDDLILALTLTTLLNPLLSWRWLKDDAMVGRNGLYVIVPAEMKNRRFTLQEVSMGFMFGDVSDISIK